MKLIFDPIYSGKVQKCSSAYKYKVLAEQILKVFPHTYINWFVPDWIDDEGRAWLPVSPNIRYHEMPISKDRVREYQKFPTWLEDRVFCIGLMWDFDFIITMRTQQIQNIQVNQSPYRDSRLHSLRKVILLEEMALLSTRKTVFVSHPEAVDHGTVSGHLLADRSYITVEHVRDQIVRTARQVLAPSQVRKLDKNLILAKPATFDTYETFPDSLVSGVKAPLKATFIGRMNKSMSQFELASESTDYDWILEGPEGISYKVSTVSEIARDTPHHCEVKFNNREQFWAMLRGETDVALYLAKDGEFSLSMIEPMCLGVPVLLNKTEQSVGIVGGDYPFFVTNKVSIFAYLKAFREDYPRHYANFIHWRDTVFRARMETGVYKNDLYAHMLGYIGDSLVARDETYVKMFPKTKMDPEEADFLKEWSKVLEEKAEVRIPVEFRKWKGFETLKIKAHPDGWREHHMAFQVQWEPMRLWAINYFGYVDGSPETGHLIHPDRFGK